MGAQLKTNATVVKQNTLNFINKDEKQNSQTITFTTDQEQIDNPLQGRIKKILNNKPLLASNNLLISKNTFQSSSSISFLNSSTKINQLQQLKENQQNQGYLNKRYNIQTTKIDSINQDVVNISIQNFQGNNPLNSFNSYVMSSQQLYDNYPKIEIHPKDFIKFKKQSVGKYYKFLQKIGQGSFGIVFKASCKNTNELRAIKLIKRKLISQKKKNQLQIQTNILSKLDHPNIIKLFQIYQDKNTFHVITEYCKGGSIVQIMLKRNVYNQKIIMTIIRQVLSALTYMHKLKIVHRDLKLQNLVFLNKIDQNSTIQDYQIKLIDFGTAFQINTKFHKINHLVGTVSYMAPEIINGFFNDKCDVWSTGVILYLLLTGKSPFKCVAKDDTLAKIQQYQLNYQKPQFNHISRYAIDLLKKMLKKNPTQRISAAQALKHPWFKSCYSGSNLFGQGKSLLKNLQKYYRINNFITKIESYLTFVKVNQQQRKKISQKFRSIDTNFNGHIQPEQLKSAYIEIHGEYLKQATQQVQYLIQKIDKNKSGKIDLQEFISAVYDKRKLFCKKYLEQTFQYFDLDGTGYIQAQELMKILAGCQKQQIEQIFLQIDLNRDSKISKQQFLIYLEKMNLVFQKQSSSQINLPKQDKLDQSNSKLMKNSSKISSGIDLANQQIIILKNSNSKSKRKIY